MRRRITLWLILALGLFVLVPTIPHPAAAAALNDVGPDRVYFPQTGHYLSYGFLNYWHHNGGIPIFGYPISEETSQNGQIVQYFQRAVFEWHPGNPPGWRVQLARLGADQTAARTNTSPFQPVMAGSNAETTFYPQTGHRLSFGFRDYWNANGGLAIFGYPISEEFTEGGYTVQYFERARFEWHPEFPGTPWEIELGLLGNVAANRNGANLTSLPRSNDVAVYAADLWYVPATQGPADVRTPPPGAPSGLDKWIEVDLTHQYLRAWEGQSLVFGTYISTGTALHPTPTGTFHVFSKLRYDDMSGGTPGVDYYSLPDVPDVMYFYEAYAIHGAYWHNNFGYVMSHGCVNLPLDAASWMFDWTPLGTTVWIH